MKQYITEEQLNELNEQEKAVLRKWQVHKKYAFEGWDVAKNQIVQGRITLLSIGQMIEFLEEFNPHWDIHPPQKVELSTGDLLHKDDDKYWEDMDMSNPYDWQIEVNSVGSYNTRELVDALWEAVKEALGD